uniref:Alpha-1,6-mannosyl-glycoprotein 2-beta-N-acetylglucosaminyltransferase n=1 Tax=Panagrellus redivivus TaxID=6233 RepID=A0A7E4WAB9_PANRE
MIFHKKTKLAGLVLILLTLYCFHRLSNVRTQKVIEVVSFNQLHESPNTSQNESKPQPEGETGLEDAKTELLGLSVNATVNPIEAINSLNYLNLHHDVYNSDTYGGLKEVSIILIIQVHNRANYLKLLIDSLANVPEINSTLLIFSHDIYDKDVEALIKGIKFAQVIQIRYPYSLQIFHDQFPGADPLDCDASIAKEKAEVVRCKNWKYPDTYGHYRIPTLSQIKHHWWWKMNYVFDGIIDRYDLNTNVLLLEEDHVVTPDVFHVLNKLIALRDTECRDCGIISLGLFVRTYTNYIRDISKVGRQTWFGKHNTGIVLNKELWNEFRNCSQLFCEFDDYNWDWSLIQISYKCFENKLIALYPKAPRVLHIGDCGVHTHKCSSQTSALKVSALFQKANHSFYPENMAITEKFSKVPKISKPNGGWGDVRDRALCKLNTHPLNSDTWDFNANLLT